MPIKNLSESVRLPRLGKIHLGIRDPEKGFPRRTEYFVLPKDHPDYQKLVSVFGDKPTSLRILIPVEDEELWASQYYKAYNQTYGMVCKGDGETAMRMGGKSGNLPDAKTQGSLALVEKICAGKECPEYQAKKCQEVMNLRFMLPEIPGLGVWQIDTGSINSILNINSSAKVIKRAFGRISLVPLKLTLEPTEVNNPETKKKQTVYVMHLRSEVTLAQLAEAAREQTKAFLLEPADLEVVYDAQVEQDIEDLFPSTPQVDKSAGEIMPPQPANHVTREATEGMKGEGGGKPPEPEKASPKEAGDSKSPTQGDTPKILHPTSIVSEEELPNGIRMVELRQMLTECQWSPADVGAFIKRRYGVTGKNQIQHLSREQAEDFMQEVQERLARKEEGV